MDGKPHAVAIPLHWVKEVISERQAADVPIATQAEAMRVSRSARWFLVLNTTPTQAWPVEDVTPPQGGATQRIYEVPNILAGWARRLGVNGFLWNEPVLIPVVVPESSDARREDAGEHLQ